MNQRNHRHFLFWYDGFVEDRNSLCFSVYVYELDATDRVRTLKGKTSIDILKRTMRQIVRKIKQMRAATPPATPPAIAPILNRFEATAAPPIVL